MTVWYLIVVDSFNFQRLWLQNFQTMSTFKWVDYFSPLSIRRYEKEQIATDPFEHIMSNTAFDNVFVE